MEGDRAHLGRPADHGYLRGTDLIRVATRRKLDPGGLHVVRSPAWYALLKEGVTAALLTSGEHDPWMHPLGPSLERRGPPHERTHDPVLDRHVVLHDVELGDRRGALGRRKDHPVGARHAQVAPTCFD